MGRGHCLRIRAFPLSFDVASCLLIFAVDSTRVRSFNLVYAGTKQDAGRVAGLCLLYERYYHYFMVQLFVDSARSVRGDFVNAKGPLAGSRFLATWRGRDRGGVAVTAAFHAALRHCCPSVRLQARV